MKITFKQCSEEVKEPIRGVIHVGSRLGSQAGIYSDARVNYVLWFEQDKTRLQQLYTETKHYPLVQQYVLETLSNTDSISYKTTRFDSFYRKNMHLIELEKYQLIIIDVENGQELNVLDGFLPLLSKYSNIKGILMNVRGPEEAEKILSPYGFKRTLTALNEINWGDALYVRS
jgi:hypothetical protein